MDALPRARVDGVSLADLRNTPAMSVEWIRRYRGGDLSAGRDLVLAHAPLVRAMARRYSRPHARDWDDCLQEGSIGILRACDSYTESNGAPSTYFWLWVRHFINRFLVTRGQCVRLPTHLYQKSPGHERARASVWKPRTRLFSEMPDLGHSDLDQAFEDALVDDAAFPDEQTSDAQIQAVMPQLAEWFLSRISKREASVLRRRFSETEETLDAIARDYGVTRERIRQVESAALDVCVQRARQAGIRPRRGESFVAWIARAGDVVLARAAVAA